MQIASLSRFGSFATNLVSRSKGFGAVALAALASASLVACGPTIETRNNSGGDGGANTTNVGVGGAGGASSSSGSGTPPSALASLTEIDLGNLSLNAFYGVNMPSNALGLTVVVQAPSLNEVIGISRLRAPSGENVIFDYSVTGKSNLAFANYGWIAGASVQSDLSAAWPMQSGQWRIALGDDDGSVKSARTRVWVRATADGVFHGGVVDINVFIAPNATSKGYLDEVFKALFLDYAGLAMGNVNFFSLDGAFSVIDTDAKKRAMLASSAGVGTNPALNLFVIDKFGADFSQAVGVAGGIPGTPTLHGTTMSGVAYQPSGNPQYDATVLRHEIGHLAGLFHTTEIAIEGTDPLSDTIECATSTIQANPDACPDKKNTMFPIAYGETDLTLGQIRVLQSSALYRGVYSAGGVPDPPLPPSKAIASPPPFEDQSSAAIVRLNKPMPAHPTPLERMLGGVWCAHENVDYEALVVRFAGDAAPATLRAFVLDDARAEILRSRALGAYVRAAATSERVRALDLAEDLARQEQASMDLRAAALETLHRFDPARARSVSVVLSGTPNHILRDMAQRILTK